MCKHILFNEFNFETDLETLRDFAERTSENDGYGSIIRLKNKDIYTYKSLNEGDFYIVLTKFLFERKSEIDTLVVHHRTSTNKNGVDYAHPFEYKGQYLTHNGVVDVPKAKKYKTKTKNDSEKLLHHLVETNYNTKDISGYFSVFMVSRDMTQIIVDGIAPIYTDGRIYSSHDLSSENLKYTKLSMSRVKITNGTIETNPIETTKSNYGMDKSYLSLGTKSTIDIMPLGQDWLNKGHDDIDRDYEKQELFFAHITDREDQELSNIRGLEDLENAIWDKCIEIGLYLDDRDINEIAEYYLDEVS